MDLENTAKHLNDETLIDAVTNLQRYFLLAALGLSSLIMGSRLTPEDFTAGVKKPVGLWLAMLAQILLAPLTAYVIALALQLHFSDGITLLVTSCCPAGALSPIFAYYTEADVCLCLSVIVISTLMSLGMIPLGVYISSNAYKELDLTVIPGSVVVIVLSVCMGSIAFGMALRKHRAKWADNLVKVLSFTPIAVTLAMVIVVRVKLPHSMDATATEVFAVLLYLLVTFSSGYVLGLLASQSHETCRAMAFCSASKSIMLSLTMVQNSFTGEVLVTAMPVPTLFLLEYISLGVLLAVVYKIYRFYVPGVMSFE